jgi:carboxymethylenebutenolidase
VPPGDGGATRAEDLVLTAADGNRFAAYLASPEGQARAQVVIYPDVRGLHQFYKDLAVRFAEQGITALAIDYFGRTAGLTARDDSFEYMPHVQQLRFSDVVADAQAAVARLRNGSGAGLTAYTVGFCMGGSLSLLSGTQDLGLTGVVAFYAGMSRDFGGAGTVLDRAAHIKVPVLGLFGGADQGIPIEQVERLDQALDATAVAHTIVIYPGAPHSFFDRRAADYAEASADAWTRVLNFVSAPSGRM